MIPLWLAVEESGEQSRAPEYASRAVLKLKVFCAYPVPRSVQRTIYAQTSCSPKDRISFCDTRITFFDQHGYDVLCDWGMAAIHHLSVADVVIIVDVLSFSTCVDIAVNRGAIVFPYRWSDNSAAEYARTMSAELAVPRDDDAGRYSLSPCSLLRVSPDLRLVLPSPNGSTLAFTAKENGATVIVGCLRNASAVASEARGHGNRIAVIAAGERWPDGSLRPAIEDTIGAGAIIKMLSGKLSPEASAAVAVFDDASACLENRLIACSSGRELVSRGFHRDVTLAAEYDVSEVVPTLVDSAFVRPTRL